MNNKINKNNWKIWDESRFYGEMFQRRANGKLEEMHASKSLCKLLSSFYKKGMSVLDVGCGAGHYLRSFRLRLDENINYTGIDATKYYIELARKAFEKKYGFVVGDILKLPFSKGEFDIVVCNNVLLHLPPPPIKAISELIRVAKKYVVIRTVFGERNYIIKEVRGPGEGIKKSFVKKVDLIDQKGNPFIFNYFNMYEKDYIKEVIKNIDKNLEVKIMTDNNWTEFDNRKVFDDKTIFDSRKVERGALATKVVGGKQVVGNLILDWKFIIIKKK